MTAGKTEVLQSQPVVTNLKQARRESDSIIAYLHSIRRGKTHIKPDLAILVPAMIVVISSHAARSRPAILSRPVLGFRYGASGFPYARGVSPPSIFFLMWTIIRRLSSLGLAKGKVMATGTNIRTYFNGAWHDGDMAIMKAADHGSWLGTTVFDGARYFDGVAPDLGAHCARVNASAAALMITPTVSTDDMVKLVWQGLESYPKEAAVYIRPMYWALDGGDLGIVPKEGATGFAICLEQIPMAPLETATTLTTTRFRRPVMEDNVVNAKAGCLYPNNARMLAEARAKGYGNALVADIMGNVAETASANVFMVKDGTVLTPIANGTFLAGITRARHMDNLRSDGLEVIEKVLTFEDFHAADEVFLSGNMMKVTPVKEFDGTFYQHGPVTKRARDLYWNWAVTTSKGF